jgi:hypothetical protein
MGGGAVVCIKCGYDSRSGKRLVTEATAQKPSKSILGYGRKDKNKPEDRMAPDGSFVLGLVLSAVFALVASLIWVGVAWLTGRNFAVIAMLIGGAAGLGMQAGHRGYSAVGGFVAAGMTILAIFAAKLTVVFIIISRAGLSFSDLDGSKVGFYFFNPIGLIIIAIGVGIAFKTASGTSS